MINQCLLWTALITPFEQNFNIDFDSIKTLIIKQEEAKNGLLILGSTGEGLALDIKQKKQIVQNIRQYIKKMPLMVGVGGYNLKKQCDWIHFCNENGADAFLLPTPLYAKPSTMGQYEWFKKLLDISTKPCMIYNIPSRSGVSLSQDALDMLSHHDNLYAIKEASGSINEYEKYRGLAPELKFYSGDDGMTPFFSLFGCEGLVSVASNAWPKATHLYVKKCLNRELSVSEIQLWRKASNTLFMAPNPIPIKTLLCKKGIIKNDTVLPPLSKKDMYNLELLYLMDSKISSWYNNQSK